MPKTDVTTKSLVINKLNKAQYDAAEKSDTELYFVPDDTTYEETANKSDSYTVSSSNTYASTKALVDGLSTKQGTITGGASTITANNLTANRALISNASGKVAVSTVTNTELGYVSGVTSGIQGQFTAMDTAKADKATTLAGYGITDAYTKSEVDEKVAGVYIYKGSVATQADLPASGNRTGDVYNVESDGTNWAWNGTAWDNLGALIDLSVKQDVLVSGENIKTINNASILGSGNMSLPVTVAELTDTTITNPSSGQFLVHDGTDWKNTTVHIPNDANNATISVKDAENTLLGDFTVDQSTAETITVPTATTSKLGLVKVDSALSSTSTNPVQNSVINSALSGKQDNLNNDQLAAVNSGVTSTTVTQVATNTSDIATINNSAVMNSGITSDAVTSYNTHLANTNIHVTSAQKSTWDAKQNTISDLDTIRSGAAAGATALQPSDVIDNVTSTATNQPLSANQGKVLKTAISNETTDRIASDQAHEAAISALNDKIGDADFTGTHYISESTDLTDAAKTLDNTIYNEKDARERADEGLSGRIDTNASAITSINTKIGDLDFSSTNYLKTKTNLTAAAIELDGQIASERTSRIAAISAEEDARVAADTQHEIDIGNLSNSVGDTDFTGTSLANKNLTQAAKYLLDEVETNASAINTERGDREAADVLLANNLDDVADDVGTIDFSETNYLTEVTDLATAAVTLDSEIKDANDTIAEESSSRQGADRSLSNRIDQKQDTLTSANAGTGISIATVEGVLKISNTQTSAEWGNITGTLSDQTDLQNALNLKLPTSTQYGSSIDLSINPETYVVTATLKDQNGTTLSTDTVDLPLESVVVSGSYDTATKEVVLVLENGTEIRFSVEDLIDGLQPEITTTNKLSADLVNDSTSTNKFVTASDKTTWNAKQNAITGAATTITTSNLTANKAVISNASGKVAVSDVTSTELGYLSGATSNIQTQIDGKVSTSGDTMTGDLKMSGSSVYLTSIGSVVASSTSKLVLGTPENEYAYLTGNTSGAFGIYTEVGGERIGIACYPERNFFADGTTNTFELGRNTNVWKKAWIKEISDGTNTITTANIVAKQNAITGAATTITDSNLTESRAVVSDSSGKVAVSTVTSTELGYLSGVTSAVQTQLNNKQATITGAATTVTSSNLDVNKALISNTSGKIAVSTVSATELGYLSGVTSNIQTQLNGKQATISGGASTITSDNLAASKALVSNASGKVVVSDVTATELGYLSGVTSAVQTQLNGKQATLTSANAGAGITITNQVISETYPLAWEQVAESSDIPQFETHVYWGNIDGSLADQTDLYNYISAKSNDDAVVHLLGTETVIGTKNFTGSCTSNTPNASASTATEYIATTGWVNNPELSTNVVHRSGDETIGGQKTFTEVIHGTAYNAYYADLAEYYKTDKAYPKGTLVCFGGKEEMTEATSEVNAVISSDPGYVLNKQEDESYQPIALIGRVPVRVIGRVEKFDYIALSKSIPGVAVATKDKNTKNIIGRALESSLLNREKLIECSIKLVV